jgi:hypothetical protein
MQVSNHIIFFLFCCYHLAYCSVRSKFSTISIHGKQRHADSYKKRIVVSLLVLSMTSIVATGQPSVYVSGEGYQGYIFHSSHFVFKSIKRQSTRFTSSTADVEKAEWILRQKLKQINEKKVNQIPTCPIIHENLTKYCRQYVGFMNAKGQKVIWINCLWNKTEHESISKEIVAVDDGCSYYWNIEVDIDSEELDNLEINGIG